MGCNSLWSTSIHFNERSTAGVTLLITCRKRVSKRLCYGSTNGLRFAVE